MDHRWQYAVGDLVGSIVIGLIVSAVSWAIVGTGWNMWVAMFSMMVLGMIIGTLAVIPAAMVLGAQEAMIPMMFNGMIAGMVVGMAAAMMPIPLAEALKMGAGSAVGGLLFIWVTNTLLRGPTSDGVGN